MVNLNECSIGAKAESVYGTIVVPDKFLQFPPDDSPSFDWDPTFADVVVMRAGSVGAPRTQLSPPLPTKQQVSGDMTVYGDSKGIGWLLKAAMGTVTTTQRGVTGVYQQCHTPLTSSPDLDSYTIQVGTVQLGGGAVQALTFAGMVCGGFELNCPNGELVKLKTSWVGQKVDTATAYAAPTYPTPIEELTFAGGSIAVGGVVVAPTTTALATGGTSVANVRDFALTFDNALDGEGFNLGGGGKRSRKPKWTARTVSGTMTIEYDSNTIRDAYLAQTGLDLLLNFTGATVIGSGSDTPALQIWIPDLRLRGELPKPNGGEPIALSVPFVGFDDGTNPLIQACYVSTDLTP